MKYLIKNISPLLVKGLTVCLLLFLLTACGKDNPIVVEEEKVAEQSCMGCQILVMMYDAVDRNVAHLHQEFEAATESITMLGFAIWLALRLLKFVSSVTETNAGEVWNEILRKAFLCTLCCLLAANSTALQETLRLLVFPIYMAFLNLGTEILGSALVKPETGTPAASFTVFGQVINVTGIEKTTCQTQPLVVSTGNVGFPNTIRETMRCMINTLSAYLAVGGSIAWQAMTEMSSTIGVIMGFIMYMFFWVVSAFFVFYLVDCIFQMGIIILLLPMFIISYAFGPTRKWTGIGMAKILASAGFMMCFAIIVFMVIRAMVELISKNEEIFNPQNAEAAFSDISIGFICLLMIGFLIYGSMGVSQQLTSGLIGGKVDANFQKNLKAVLQTGLKMVGTALGALFTWGMAIAPQSNIALVRNTAKVIKNVQKIHEKIQRLAGRR